MNIIYLHGLDSNANATKGQITDQYAKQQGIDVVRPDLNLPPKQALDTILTLITPDSVLIGSSLGGYFANLVSDLTATPAILLNPSIRPDLSFRRFLSNEFLPHNQTANLNDDTVIYRTQDGWDIVYGDLAWFENHRLTVKYPNKIKVLLKMGDELLDAFATQAFYHDKKATVIAQAGGDHRMSDYQDNIADVLTWACQLQQTP